MQGIRCLKRQTKTRSSKRQNTFSSFFSSAFCLDCLACNGKTANGCLIPVSFRALSPRCKGFVASKDKPKPDLQNGKIHFPLSFLPLSAWIALHATEKWLMDVLFLSLSGLFRRDARDSLPQKTNQNQIFKTAKYIFLFLFFRLPLGLRCIKRNLVQSKHYIQNFRKAHPSPTNRFASILSVNPLPSPAPYIRPRVRQCAGIRGQTVPCLAG